MLTMKQTGLGGCIFPFLTSGLLNRFGYKTTMISLGVGYAVLGSIALIPIRRRIPLSRYDFAAPGRRKHKTDWSVLRTLPMFMGVMTILFTSLGNFIPSLWLPCMFIIWPLSSPTDIYQPMRMTSISMTPTVLLLSPYLTVPPCPVTPSSATSLIAFLFVLPSRSLVWVVLWPAPSCGVSGQMQGC